MENVRLWHDDVRPAPQGWLWARTNEQAQKILSERTVVECSLDHDLGYHDVAIPDDPDELAEVLFLKGQAEETGLDLCDWMVEHDVVPPVVTIHSWNPAGAKAMAMHLAVHAHYGTIITITPFGMGLSA